MTPKEWRTRAAAHARTMIKAGEKHIVIALPPEQPNKRQTYQTVSAIAHGLLGSGAYKLRQRGDAVVVTIAEPPANA